MSLTAQDLIEGNIGYIKDAVVGEYKGRECILATQTDNGRRIVIFWEGDKHVDFPADDLDELSFESAMSTLRNAQPGVEFATVWDDVYAATLRGMGFEVTRDSEGHPVIDK